MIDHSTASHVPLDQKSILKTLIEAIDAAAEIDKQLQGSTRLSFHVEAIKQLAYHYRKVYYCK